MNHVFLASKASSLCTPGTMLFIRGIAHLPKRYSCTEEILVCVGFTFIVIQSPSPSTLVTGVPECGREGTGSERAPVSGWLFD